MESEEGKGSGDIRMAEALGTEPLVTFSSDKDIVVQFIQLFQALGQQERRQVWPMLCSLTVQMKHCDSCLKDYCSVINYSRHNELHKRDSEEESAKNRIALAQFWDKITPEEAKEVLSLKDIVLKEVSWSSVIKELRTTTHKAGFSYLPEPYLKSGSQILDIIEGGRFPISSEQLFRVFDCTSEKTFLCGPSLEKYIMDGNNTERMVIESRNVIAYTGIQLERKLIGAWLVDREAKSEMLRKLLEEEEEAALKSRNENLEKKKQKKLRKREQNKHEQGTELKEDIEMASEERSSDVEHIDPPDVLVSGEQATLATREIDCGYGSNGDESPFLPIVGCESRQRLLRRYEAVEATSSLEDQGSQASTLAFDSQSPKLTLSPVHSHQEAQDSQASNLELASKPPKLATCPSSFDPAKDSQVPKFADFTTYSHAPQGHQGPNLSHAPSRSQPNSQAPELKKHEQGAELKEDVEMASGERSSAIDHTDPDVLVSDEQTALATREIDCVYGSNDNENPFLPVLGRKSRQRLLRRSKAVESTSSREDQGSQASALAFDSQSMKRTMSPVNSHQKAQDSQASKLDLTSKPPKLATFHSNFNPAKDSQAPKFAGFSTYSRALQGHRPPNLSHAPSRPQQNSQAPKLPDWWTFSHLASRSANDPRALNASFPAQRSRPPRHHRNRGAHRTASSSISQSVLTSCRESELGGGFCEASVQKDSTCELQDRVEPEPPNEPTIAREEPEAPAMEQETTNEQDLTKEHQAIVGSLAISTNPEFESPPFTFGTFNLQEQDKSEAHGTIPMAEGQEPELVSSHDEPKEPEPVQSGTTDVLWTETLIPNGSRDVDAGFVNMKGNIFENMAWEDAIHIAEAFNQERWKKAIEGEHFTLCVVPASENATKTSPT